MKVHGPKSRNFATNSLFAALSLGGIGWGLLHAWGISVGIGVLFHAMAAMPGIALSSLVLHRYRQHWPVATPACAGQRKLPRDIRAMAFYVVLVAAGVGMALLISAGSLFFLVVASMGMIFFPWVRTHPCRNHFFFSSALIGLGVLLGLAVLDRPAYSLYYLIVAWLLLSTACMLITLVLVIHGNRLDRMPVSGY